MKEKKDINVEIGRNIQREREKAGYTQEGLSEMIGLGPKSLSSAERGVVGVSLSTLKQICTVLSIPSDRLIFGELEKQDVSQISERLERLSPRQFEVACKVLNSLMEAFALSESGESFSPPGRQ